ncbi:MAG: DNA polymerase I [Chlamydiales bacterium]|nr:DNA polymerase I [Chlamydiales bacterium]MCH9619706.1 DNA polymerase I [Chlamydiales bacterium]MCH9623312.1 DNA polymerase I [Chlamydiales bacterium]
MKLFLLDVSGFIFRAYFAIPTMTNSKGEPTNALFGFIRSVNKLIQDFGCEHMVAVFDGPNNKASRKKIYEDYKANRTQDNEDLPEQIEKAKLFCQLAGIPIEEVDGVEADDTIGSLAKWAEKEGMEVFLCSSDKDLCQLVTEKIHLLNPWKNNLILDPQGVEEVYGVPPSLIIDYLAITGDQSDNIPGLRGFGPKTAVSLLQEFRGLEAILQNPDKVKGAKKQETLQQESEIARLSYQLATIQTNVPFRPSEDQFTIQPPHLDELKEFYLENGFNSFVKELGIEIPDEKEVYHLVDDEEGLNALIKELEKADGIVFDIESTSLNPLLAEIVGIGFCTKCGVASYVPLGGQLGKGALEKLKPLFRSASFIGHNIKYDCHVLANVGIEVKNLSFDTILASYLLNSSSRRHSLDTLALEYFGKVKTSIKSLIGTGKNAINMRDVPIDKVSDYCCEDVDYTFRLYEKLSNELKERKLENLLFDLELPLSPVLMKMERSGMYLDVSHLEIMGKEISEEIACVEKKIFEMAGEEFNLNSPKQLGVILFEKLAIPPLKKGKTGNSTRAEVLEELAIHHPIAEEILNFRTLDKLRSTYIEALPKEVNPKTGRIHPTFNQFIAATGRLACQNPNLQNIPVRTPQGRRIREAFRPQKEGWSFLSADYSQIELRLLAHLCEEPKLIHAFLAGEDIHSYTARLIFGTRDVTKEQRHQAKAINFGIIYGQQAYGLSKELKIDRKEAAAFIEAYYKRYPKVFDYINSCIEIAKKSQKTVTMTGRERQIPEINSTNAILKSAAQRLAVNSPLQGTAADLIKEAMLAVDALLIQKKMKSFMVLQVHDELIFEAPDEELPELKKLVKEAMEGVYSLKVPLIVDIDIGKNWGEC